MFSCCDFLFRFFFCKFPVNLQPTHIYPVAAQDVAISIFCVYINLRTQSASVFCVPLVLLVFVVICVILYVYEMLADCSNIYIFFWRAYVSCLDHCDLCSNCPPFARFFFVGRDIVGSALLLYLYTLAWWRWICSVTLYSKMLYARCIFRAHSIYLLSSIHIAT